MTGGDAYQDMTVDTGKATKPSLGFWLETESGVACEIAAEMGYGVVILDMEHGRLSRDGAARLIRLAQDRGLTVYSRVAAPEAVSVQDALEAGAYGVIIPQLRDLGHAREVAAFAKYPPLGSRAIGRSGRPSDLTDGEDRRTRYFPMIETAGALEDASRIAALDTVMACFSVRPICRFRWDAGPTRPLKRMREILVAWRTRPRVRARNGRRRWPRRPCFALLVSTGRRLLRCPMT